MRRIFPFVYDLTRKFDPLLLSFHSFTDHSTTILHKQYERKPANNWQRCLIWNYILRLLKFILFASSIKSSYVTIQKKSDMNVIPVKVNNPTTPADSVHRCEVVVSVCDREQWWKEFSYTRHLHIIIEWKETEYNAKNSKSYRKKQREKVRRTSSNPSSCAVCAQLYANKYIITYDYPDNLDRRKVQNQKRIEQ